MEPGWGAVMVVDDDPTMGLYASRQIRQIVGSVTVAQSGPEALALLKAQSFDLLLLDIIMPKMNGYQVLEAIRADADLPQLPILVISSADDLEGVVRCIELGAEDYLVKPLNPVLLRARVAACLERKWLRDQEQAYLRQLEAEKAAAEAANRAKSIFLANMSHELRTPLNAIMGYSEILKEDVSAEGCEFLVPDLDKIHQSGQHLLGLINDILDISKLEAGRVELTATQFAVADLVEAVVQSVKPSAIAKGNTLQVHYQATLPPLHTDLGKVQQILSNLLSNAAKFTEQGTITFTVDETVEERSPTDAANSGKLQPPRIRFSVADTGIGMAPDAQEQIFQAFTQVDDSTTRKYGGTGLGLAISYRYAQLLGGSITVESTPGVGSTFVLDLPLTLPNPASSPSESLPPEPAGDPEPRSSGLVLVIDDDRAVRDWMVERLNQQGYRVITAWGGKEGLRLARDVRPDWIVLDMLMPSLESWAVLSTLKSERALETIPVVMMATKMPPVKLESSARSPSGYGLGLMELVLPGQGHRLVAHLEQLANPADTPVLLYHPDEVTRHRLATPLQQAGWRCIEVENSGDWPEQATGQAPAVLLLDLLQLSKEGFHIIEQVRRQSLRPVRVVAIATRELTPTDHSRLNGRIEQFVQFVQHEPTSRRSLDEHLPYLIPVSPAYPNVL
ncbi:response regulator [Leptolyngbya sp. AN02str]|uniref:response regulator n=1 Tax=Leptolyngbya sp. AN02str TaxID=3423363 RepID=UPI003D3203FA